MDFEFQVCRNKTRSYNRKISFSGTLKLTPIDSLGILETIFIPTGEQSNNYNIPHMAKGTLGHWESLIQ